MNKLPKLVVFDLDNKLTDKQRSRLLVMFHIGYKLVLSDFVDFTLWPLYVDTHVTPPFSLERPGLVVDKYGYRVRLYEEVIDILEWLQNKSVKLALASRTSACAAGKELIQILDVEKFFHYKEIYPGCKINHFQKFMQNSGLDFTEMLFFDDEERNIRDISKLGVTCVHVPDGITMALVQRGLHLHAQKLQS